MRQLDFVFSSIKMPYLLNINNLYFDMDISLYNYNILDIFVYVILLLLLLLLLFLLTIIYYSSINGREKKLVNFNESSVEIYDSGDDIHCSSASDNCSSGNSDDGDDEEKLNRRRRRWLHMRDYYSKYSAVGRVYDPTKNNNKNYNTYARGVKDVFYGGRRPGSLRNHLLDKKMYKDTVRELNKANIQNPNLNLDLDTLSRVHANRYNNILYNNKDYDYNNLTVDQLDFLANRYNIRSLHDCKQLFQSIDSDKLRAYLDVSESIHKKYIERKYNHTKMWDGWFARQVAKTIWK